MKWVDVCGPPGSGKSTLCDPLWGPHDVDIMTQYPPVEWHEFINEISRLFYLIRGIESFNDAIRMNNRSIMKIATVAQFVPTPDMEKAGRTTYVQTALIQRGFGFGWRLQRMGVDVNEMQHYFRLMPVSVGAAFIRCPQDVVIKRNHDRTKVADTAHENRDYMVPLMQPCIDLAFEVLNERKVPIIELDTTKPVEEVRAQLVEFASRKPFDAKAGRLSCEVAALSPPPFWIRPRFGTNLPVDDKKAQRLPDASGIKN